MIELTLELSELVEMQQKHTISYISLKMATGLPFAKTLIEYNNNELKENEEERSQLILNLLS